MNDGDQSSQSFLILVHCSIEVEDDAEKGRAM